MAISSEQLVLEIATPVCALVRNDRGSRQPPTIILQITLLVSVKQGDLYLGNCLFVRGHDIIKQKRGYLNV